MERHEFRPASTEATMEKSRTEAYQYAIEFFHTNEDAFSDAALSPDEVVSELDLGRPSAAIAMIDERLTPNRDHDPEYHQRFTAAHALLEQFLENDSALQRHQILSELDALRASGLRQTDRTKPAIDLRHELAEVEEEEAKKQRLIIEQVLDVLDQAEESGLLTEADELNEAKNALVHGDPEPAKILLKALHASLAGGEHNPQAEMIMTHWLALDELEEK